MKIKLKSLETTKHYIHGKNLGLTSFEEEKKDLIDEALVMGEHQMEPYNLYILDSATRHTN